MDLSLYEKKANATSSSEAFIKDTISYVNSVFTNSPSYKQVTINGELKDTILNHTDNFNELEILFKPLEKYPIGSYVEVDTDTYMLMNFVSNDIYPKGEIQLCNSILKWKDSVGDIKEYKCIVTGNSYDYSSSDSKKQIITSESELIVLVQYNEDTRLIKPTQRFIFGESAFDVDSVDLLSNIYNNKGYIKLVVKFANLSSTDDTTTGVADDSGNSDWGGW